MVFQIYTIDCDSMREGLCSTCKIEINESMKVCPNCGTPILWDPQAQGYPPQGYPPVQGAPVAGYPTSAAVQKKKARHRVASFFCLVFSFVMILAATAPWVQLDTGVFGYEEDFTLGEIDDVFDTDYAGPLVFFAVIAMILSLISLIRYHIVLKCLVILFGFIAFIMCINTVVNIADDMNDTIIISEIWYFTPTPFFYLIGSILVMISAAAMRSPRKVAQMAMPQQPYGVSPRVQ